MIASAEQTACVARRHLKATEIGICFLTRSPKIRNETTKKRDILRELGSFHCFFLLKKKGFYK